MKLSEAILEGCKITKPLNGSFVDDKKNITCACSVGAARLAYGVYAPENITNYSRNRIFYEAVSENNIANFNFIFLHYKKHYGTEIYKDSDSGVYTREQIAARIAALGY